MRNIFRAVVIIAAGISLSLPATAPAAVMQLGNSGWTMNWDSTGPSTMSVGVQYADADVVVLGLFLRFTQAPEDGVFRSVHADFQQTRADAVPHILINSAVVENLTGTDWNGFVFSLADSLLPDVVQGTHSHFDAQRTAIHQSTGFDVLPFTAAAYTNNDQTLTLSDGIVSSIHPVTNLWMPGSARGALWISAHPTAAGPFRSFSMNQVPLPEPASLASLLVGGMLLLRRSPGT